MAKDAAHPFKIHCGSLTTQVLGTSFNIRNTWQGNQVTVLTGKIPIKCATVSQGDTPILTSRQYIQSRLAAIVKQEQHSSSVQELTKRNRIRHVF